MWQQQMQNAQSENQQPGINKYKDKVLLKEVDSNQMLKNTSIPQKSASVTEKCLCKKRHFRKFLFIDPLSGNSTQRSTT